MPNPELRTVVHENRDRRVIGVLHRSPETDRMSDEEIAADLDEWMRSRRPHPADDDNA